MGIEASEALATLWAYLPRELTAEGSNVTPTDIRFSPDTSVTFSARDISLYDALVIVCAVTDCELYYEGFTPRLRARPDAQQSVAPATSEPAPFQGAGSEAGER
jgi:hypothetical protein